MLWSHHFSFLIRKQANNQTISSQALLRNAGGRREETRSRASSRTKTPDNLKITHGARVNRPGLLWASNGAGDLCSLSANTRPVDTNTLESEASQSVKGAGHPRSGGVWFFIRFGEMSQQWMLCSEWVPSEWESDKNITIIHTTPVHQLTSGEDKNCVFVINQESL